MPTASGKLTATEMNRLKALIRAQAAVRDQLSQTAADAVARAFGAIKDFWDTEQTVRAVEQSVRIVQAQQRRMAQVTDGYMAQSTSIIMGSRYRPVGAVDITRLRRELPQPIIETLAHAKTSEQGVGPGLTRQELANIERAKRAITNVEPGKVYGRIADAYRYRLTSGLMDDRQARTYVEQRARVVADTDVSLADRAQSQAFMSERRPKGSRGYRRVIHPELGSGAPPCGLCVIAADVIYSFEELMPIHARCRCTVTAVGAEDDPGFKLNRDDLKAIYKQAGGTGGKGLKAIRVEVVEHGELGPWLVNPTQRFRGPREYAKTQSNDPAEKALAQLDTLRDDLELLLIQKASGMDVDKAEKWHRYKIRELNARIAA